MGNTFRIVYNLSAFNSAKAASGELCVMVVSNYSGSTIDNIIPNSGNNATGGTPNAEFKGAGICSYNNPDYYTLVIDEVAYTFNGYGNASSRNAVGWKLMMGTPQDDVVEIGNAVARTSTASTIKNSQGAIGTVVDYSTPSTVMVGSITARDEFAVQALKCLLAHIPDPSILSPKEISYYCHAAYEWAAGMMTAAAKARTTYTDNSGSSTATTKQVGELETNTEKLLNNLIVAVNGISGGGGGSGTIADGSVTHEKLDDESVDTNNLRAGSVTTPIIDDEAVTFSKLNNSDVTGGVYPPPMNPDYTERINYQFINKESMQNFINAVMNYLVSNSNYTILQSYTPNASYPERSCYKYLLVSEVVVGTALDDFVGTYFYCKYDSNNDGKGEPFSIYSSNQTSSIFQNPIIQMYKARGHYHLRLCLKDINNNSSVYWTFDDYTEDLAGSTTPTVATRNYTSSLLQYELEYLTNLFSSIADILEDDYGITGIEDYDTTNIAEDRVLRTDSIPVVPFYIQYTPPANV